MINKFLNGKTNECTLSLMISHILESFGFNVMTKFDQRINPIFGVVKSVDVYTGTYLIGTDEHKSEISQYNVLIFNN